MASACTRRSADATQEALSIVCTRLPGTRESQPGSAGWRRGPQFRGSWRVQAKGRGFGLRGTHRRRQKLWGSDASREPISPSFRSGTLDGGARGSEASPGPSGGRYQRGVETRSRWEPTQHGPVAQAVGKCCSLHTRVARLSSTLPILGSGRKDRHGSEDQIQCQGTASGRAMQRTWQMCGGRVPGRRPATATWPACGWHCLPNSPRFFYTHGPAPMEGRRVATATTGHPPPAEPGTSGVPESDTSVLLRKKRNLGLDIMMNDFG